MQRLMVVVLAVLATVGGCNTSDPVPTGQNTYLIEGGVGLTGATFSVMVNHAMNFARKGLANDSHAMVAMGTGQ